MQTKSAFPPGSKLIAYLRDSGGDDQELSIEQQETVVNRWCSENSHELLRIFRDVAAPGSSTIGREGFQAMVQYLRAKDCPAAGVVIWKYSRFARDIDDAQFYKADLRRRGYIIHSLNDVVPPGNDGRFFEAAIDWMNTRFLDDLSTDVKRGLRHLVEHYGGMPGTPPRGFIRHPVEIGRRRDGSQHIVHRWVPDPDLWETCRLAWHMRAGGATYKEINAACHLYSSLNSYNTFFANRLFLGELVFGDLVIPGYVEPLIDQATWDAVQAQARQLQAVNGHSSATHPRRAASSYILSGLARCTCGAPLNGKSVSIRGLEHYAYYYCSLANRAPQRCRAKQIPREVLEDAVLESVHAYILSPEAIAARQADLIRQHSDQTGEASAQRAELAARLAAVRRSITRIVNAIAEIGHSPALVDRLRAAESEEGALRVRLNQLDAWLLNPPEQITGEQIASYSAQLRTLLRSADADTRRQILNGFIERIVVERTGRLITGIIHYYQPPADLIAPLANPDPPGDFYAYDLCPHGGTIHTHKIFTIRFTLQTKPP